MGFMTDPQQLAAQHWKNAEALIEHFEQAVRTNSPPEQLLESLLLRLRTTVGADSVSLSAIEADRIETLARAGIALSDDHDRDLVNEDRQVVVDRKLLNDTTLVLDLRFAESVSLSVRQLLEELSEALLDFCSVLYLRTQITRLRHRLNRRTDDDRWIARLYQGSSLNDSFASIAAAIAAEQTVDRVSLLRRRLSNTRWIACSSQGSIDRRARQVRLMEQVVREITASSDRYEFCLTDNPASRPLSLIRYLDESGCQEIYCELVEDSDTAIVLERFRIHEPAGSLSTVLDPIRDPVLAAIRNAVGRNDSGWRRISNQFAEIQNRSKLMFVAIAAVVTLLASLLIQIPLQIPVSGRLIAANSWRLYAPVEGIVDDVLVSDGDSVHPGTPLIQLHSPALELQQRSIEGALATARSRLDSLQVTRGDRRTDDQRDPNLRSDEKVLKTEIQGLETQLDLIEQQQADLLVTSPIEGQVNRWDLRTSLMTRPVAVGQYLVSVVSEADGWNVELEIPDNQVGYVLDQQQRQPCKVSYRLRSDPTVVHAGQIARIADSAKLDPSGDSIVTASMQLAGTDAINIRDGATVLAQIDCGKRPIGFVFLRGVIEWWRSSSWF